MEDLKELLAKSKRERSIPGIHERFYTGVREYLAWKFPDILDHEVDEAAMYIGQRFAMSMNDVLIENNREWQKIVDRIEDKKHKKSIYELKRRTKIKK